MIANLKHFLTQFLCTGRCAALPLTVEGESPELLLLSISSSDSCPEVQAAQTPYEQRLWLLTLCKTHRQHLTALRVISHLEFKCKGRGGYWSCVVMVSARGKPPSFVLLRWLKSAEWAISERNCGLSPCDSFPLLFWQSLLTFITSFAKAGSNHNFQLTSAKATKCSALPKTQVMGAQCKEALCLAPAFCLRKEVSSWVIILGWAITFIISELSVCLFALRSQSAC